MVTATRWSGIASVPAALLALLGIVGVAAPAHAQIREPGAHPKYTVDLEPHFVLQWEYTDGNSDGIGVGGRVSIPVIDNGRLVGVVSMRDIGFALEEAACAA